jgi:hypothetical protein
MTIHPSSTNKKLFLSAVSSEFESYRQLLAADLKRPTLDVAVQEDFIVSGGLTLQKLDDYIKACHGIVHLIGKATGATPEAGAVKELLTQYPDFTERLPPLSESLKQTGPGFSYTQWEAYLAIYHQRPIFIYLPSDFDLDERTCPREDRFVYDAAQERSQREHYNRICALGRDRGRFLNQERLSSAVLRDLVEILPRLESRIDVPPTKLRHTAEVLIGRDEELTMLDDAWNDSHKNVVVVRGKGGEGKTSLVASWMAELALKDWRGAEGVFDWSFYSQGTKDQGTASAEQFIIAALTFFGDPDPNRGAFEERGVRLAQLVGSKRSLLVLDGLEPLQYPPGPMHGQLTDKGMAALLKGLAGQNAGLCVVTTREKVDEVKQHYGKSAIDHPLEFLSPIAGAALLHYAGARRAGQKTIARDDKELQQASIELHGHALTLFLIGQYLKLTEDGDIRRRDRMKLADAEAEYKNDATRPYGHAFKAIEAYEKWFAKGDDQAKRQLAILRLLGLFDRPASDGCLTALRAEPTIADLNDAIAGGSNKEWNIALNRLQEINLVRINEDKSVDCHPLIREFFAAQLRVKNVNAWQAGHRRLYEHLCATTPDKPQPKLEDLQPLYQAVAHGCQAGLQQEVCDKVYFARIIRRREEYSWRKLGAFGSDLGAVTSFFEQPWNRLSPSLTEMWQAWLLGEAAFRLRALGRLTEALDPMRAGLEMCVTRNDWKQAAIHASNLSELELTLGDVAGAVGDAEQSVTHADRSGDAYQMVTNRTRHADALHQLGRRSEAEARLREAEQMQANKSQPEYPLLYSISGFQYCDLLLAVPERAAWQIVLESGDLSNLLAAQIGRRVEIENGDESAHSKTLRAVSQRAAQTLMLAEDNNLSLLTIAFDHLTLGRAALYASILECPDLRLRTSDLSHIDAALDDLRHAGQQQYVPLGLVTRAWSRSLTGHTGPVSAQEDLDEAWEIAERGPMRLFMADIHLYRARLFGGMTGEGGGMKYPWDKNPDGSPRGPKDDLADARKLIDQCGYWRRKEQLEDAEEAAKNWE